MQLANAFCRLGNYLAYKAGLLRWGQLPLNTQVCAIKYSTPAPWPVAPVHAAQAVIITMRTGGKLTGVLPTVPHTASTSNALQGTVTMRRVR